MPRLAKPANSAPPPQQQQDWSAEKKQSNAITAAVEKAKYTDALREIGRLRESILCKLQTGAATRGKQAARADRSTGGADAMLICFPAAEASMQTCALLVVACQMNVLRCWIGLKLHKILPYVDEAVSDAPGSVMSWMDALKSVDAKAFGSQLLQLAGLLLRTAELAPGSEEEAVGALTLHRRIVELLSLLLPTTPTVTKAKLCDIVLRGAYAYEKTAYFAVPIAMNYYSRCHDTLTSSDISITAEPKYASLFDHHVHLACKASSLDKPEPVFRYLQQVVEIARSAAFPQALASIAQQYFRLGSALYKQRQFESALLPLQQSCTLLGGDWTHCERTWTHEEAVSLSKRFEVLSRCQSSVGQHESARASVAQAVLLLSDSPELRMPIMQRYVEQHMPVRNSRQYRSLSSAVADHSNVDCHLLSSIVQAELDILLEKGARFETLLPLTEQLVGVWSKQHPLRRARAVICQVKLLLRAPDQTPAQKVEGRIAELLQLCKQEDLVSDVELAPTRLDLLATAYSLQAVYAFRNGTDGSDAFGLALTTYKLAMKGVAPYSANPGERGDPAAIEHARTRFRSVDETFHHIASVACYFAVLRQPIFQLQAYQLLLRLCTVLDRAAEACSCYLNIASAYLQMGYTAEAGAALGMCRGILERRDMPDAIETRYLVTYATYLAHVGNLAKSEKVLHSIRWDSLVTRQDTSALDGSIASPRLLLAGGCNAFALLNVAKGQLTRALLDQTRGLAFLQREARRVLTSHSQHEQPASSLDVSAGLLFFHCEWDIIQHLLSALQSLCHLHLASGSFVDALFFAKQGKAVAKLAHSPQGGAQFDVCIAQVHTLRRDFDCSLGTLKMVLKEMQQSEPQILCDVSVAQLAAADLHIRRQAFQEAATALKGAETVLGKLRDPAYLSGLFSATARVHEAATPRAQKVLQLGQSTADHLKSPKALVKLGRTALAAVESELTCREAMLQLELGQVARAEESLQQLVDVELPVAKEVDFSMCSAQVLNSGLQQDVLSFHPSLAKLLLHSVVVFSDDLAGKKRRGRAQDQLMRRLLSAEQHALQVLASGIACGSPATLHSVARLATFLRLCKMVLGQQRGADSDVTALIGYLGTLNMVTAMRELSFVQLERREAGAVVPSWWQSAPRQPDLAEPMLRLALDDDDDANDDDKAENGGSSAVSAMNAASLPSSVSSLLPADWLVCCLSVDSATDSLYVSRIARDEPPVLVRLPMLRRQVRKGNVNGYASPAYGYEKVLGRWQDILAGNNASIQQGKQCLQPTDKAEWWATRRRLDKGLQTLLKETECAWLGPFRGLLSLRRFSNDAATVLQTKLHRLVSAVVSGAGSVNGTPASHTRSTRSKTASTKGATVPVLPLSVCHALLSFCGPDHPCTQEDAADLVHYMLDMARLCDGGDSLEVERADVNKIIEQTAAFLSSFVVAAQDTLQPFSHIVLVLDRHLQQMPLESMPVLRAAPAVRVPSLAFLYDRLARRSGSVSFECDASSAAYVLNPSGDLSSTQTTFDDALSKHTEWYGIVGRPPTAQEFTAGLTQHELFLYFGHGAGEAFLSGHKVRRVAKCAVTILMGCSSGALRDAGDFDPHGMSVNYMVNGCPALVANLWDVTDRDIDRFSMTAMEKWGLLIGGDDSAVKERISLVQAVAASRDACVLPYLVGAAPVVYGVPVYLRTTTNEAHIQQAAPGG